jgi:hypothetical protein
MHVGDWRLSGAQVLVRMALEPRGLIRYGALRPPKQPLENLITLKPWLRAYEVNYAHIDL